MAGRDRYIRRRKSQQSQVGGSPNVLTGLNSVDRRAASRELTSSLFFLKGEKKHVTYGGITPPPQLGSP